MVGSISPGLAVCRLSHVLGIVADHQVTMGLNLGESRRINQVHHPTAAPWLLGPPVAGPMAWMHGNLHAGRARARRVALWSFICMDYDEIG